VTAPTKGGKVTGLVLTIIIAAVIYTGLPQLITWSTKDKTKPRAVTVGAIWEPSPREPGGVAILTLVEGQGQIQNKTTAPFIQSFSVTQGTRVEIRAKLVGPGKVKLLGCSISLNGAEMVREHVPNATSADEVTCWVVVP